MSLEKYYYERLSPQSQAAYRALREGLEKRLREIEFFETPQGELDAVFKALELDNPQFFYVNWWAPITCFSRGGDWRVRFSYIHGEEDVARMNREIDALARSIAGIATLSKILAVHDWFLDNVTYDRKGLDALIQSPSMYSPVGPLEKRKGVCMGISTLACVLLRKKGVDAAVMTGRCRESGVLHAWNAVGLNGECRHVDITFDMGMSSGGERSRRFFCLTQSEIAVDRSIT